MRTLLDENIRVGGTTAITNELSPDEMRGCLVSGENVASCFGAIHTEGTVTGFSSLSAYGSLPVGWDSKPISSRTALRRHMALC